MDFCQRSLKTFFALFLKIESLSSHCLSLFIYTFPVAPLLCFNSLIQSKETNFISVKLKLNSFCLSFVTVNFFSVISIFSFIFLFLISRDLVDFTFEIFYMGFHLLDINFYLSKKILFICIINLTLFLRSTLR